MYSDRTFVMRFALPLIVGAGLTITLPLTARATEPLKEDLESVTGALSVAVTERGTVVAAWGKGYVGIWDLRTGEPLQSFRYEPDTIAAVSPRRGLVAVPFKREVGNEFRFEVQIIDSDTKKTVRQFSSNGGAYLEFSGKDTYFAEVTRSGRYLIWTVEDWKLRASGQLQADHERFVQRLTLSRDATLMAVGWGQLEKPKPEDLTDPNALPWLGQIPPVTITIHSLPDVRRTRMLTINSSGWLYAMRFSHDGKLLATGCDDSHVRLWDVATGREVKAFKCDKRVVGVAFSPDDGHLLGISNDEHHWSYAIWDLSSAKRVLSWKHDEELSASDVVPAVYSPDGKYILTASYGPEVRVWGAETGKLFRTLKLKDTLRK